MKILLYHLIFLPYFDAARCFLSSLCSPFGVPAGDCTTTHTIKPLEMLRTHHPGDGLGTCRRCSPARTAGQLQSQRFPGELTLMCKHMCLYCKFFVHRLGLTKGLWNISHIFPVSAWTLDTKYTAVVMSIEVLLLLLFSF